jgi:hypothetical protein
MKDESMNPYVAQTCLIDALGTQLVLCRPGSAQKPRLRLGLRGLRLSNNLGRAKAPRDGRLRPGSAKAPAFDSKLLKSNKVDYDDIN